MTQILKRYPGFGSVPWTAALSLLLLLTTAVLPATAAPGAEDDDRRFVWVHNPAYRIALGGTGFLGVQTLDATPELREHMGGTPEAGVLIGKVLEDSPAATAGLEVGDLLTHFDGEEVTSPRQVLSKVSFLEEDTTVQLEVIRDGRPLTLQATVAKRNLQDFPSVRRYRDALRFVPKGLPGGVFPLDQLKDNRGLFADPESLEKVEEFFDSSDWHGLMERYQGQRGNLQKRIDELEQRLQQMEEQLGDLEGGDEL